MNFGVVVIGRNEGERLRQCLESVTRVTDRVIYVDSGSTDGSVTMVLDMGLGIVELDLHIPFTAARARNEGCKLLLKHSPDLEYIQFVDGDCELVEGWLETAAVFLNTHKDVAMVCGRLRERYPEHSVYNLLCDIEWDRMIGDAKACGGIAMARVEALEAEGWYRADMIAGEEPELCVRLRASGWRIWQLEIEMALHDAAMIRFGQWWKRTQRTGYAYAEGAHLHGASPEMHRVNESRRAWIWGVGIPAIAVCLAVWLGMWSLTILMVYPLQVVRIVLRGRRSVRENWWYGLFLVLAKFPEAIGQLKYIFNRLTRKTAKLIEYK